MPVGQGAGLDVEDLLSGRVGGASYGERDDAPAVQEQQPSNRPAEQQLAARLTELRIAPMAAVESYSTPRRLTARIGKIAERQEDLEETLSGPPVSAAFDTQGKPTPAALGFAKKQGVAFEELSRVSTAKGEYLAYHKRQRGKSAVDALPDLLSGLLRDLSFPKQMHWDAKLDDGRGELLIGRPIRWLLFLYAGRVVPFTIGHAANAAGQQVLDV
ncbi:MAG: glycine--tRNA ligase subunit beta, partial [Acidobacteria bacterium]|nr:glycine--tRNA ligase subunit beta [Acidobacteriota bacterium]